LSPSTIYKKKGGREPAISVLQQSYLIKTFVSRLGERRERERERKKKGKYQMTFISFLQDGGIGSRPPYWILPATVFLFPSFAYIYV
jgi:hypothetical protein